MKLTILGNNGPFPGAGGACSGYLIREGSFNLLIDCGNGVLANLQKLIRLDQLDAVILTHLHSDHMSDMRGLRYFWQIKRNRGELDRPLKVYAPPEPAGEHQRLDIKDVYDLKSTGRDTVLELGGMKITFEQMTHPVMDLALSIESGGKRFVFSGDTSWNQSIIDFAGGAELLMLDAGLLAKEKRIGAAIPHLTAEECGVIAARAGAKKLLLTHFWPGNEKKELLAEAQAQFANVQTAELLAEYEI